jgi:ankyrin repeat protein
MTHLLPQLFMLTLLCLVSCGKQSQDQANPKSITENHAIPEIQHEYANELKAAVISNDLTNLKRLVFENQINLSKERIDDEPLLVIAIRSNANEIRNYLLERGANIEAATIKDETPLMAAVASNQENTLFVLLKMKPMLDRANDQGDTALHIAIKKGLENIALTLIENGANIKKVNRDGLSPFELARDAKMNKLVQTLRNLLMLELEAPDLYSFRDAITSGDSSTLEKMLNNFPELCSTYNLINPLSLAMKLESEEKGLEVATLLLDHGCDVNGSEEAENTPLVESILEQKENFFDFLMAHKAKIQILDKEGKSALIHAIEMNNLKMVERLIGLSAMQEYSFRKNGKKISFDACDIVKNTSKKLKASKEKKINEKIKDKLDCGFWDWVF